MSARAARRQSTQSTMMQILAFLLILCTTRLHADLVRMTASSEVENKIQTTDYILVIFCDAIDSDECSADTEEFDGYFNDGIEDFPDIVGVVTDAKEVAEKYGILEYPTLLFFRKGNPMILQAEELENYDFPVWLQKHRDLHTNVLTDDNFEHDTQASTGATTGDWFIMFYDQSCLGSLASWEHVAISLTQTKVVGRVDLSTNPKLKKRFEEFKHHCPSFTMFSHGKMYEYEDDIINVKHLVTFAKGGFKKQDGFPVPKEVRENIVANLSAAVASSFKSASLLARGIIIGGVVLLVLLIFIIIIVVAAKKKQQRAKFD